jgi:hypothetical protein
MRQLLRLLAIFAITLIACKPEPGEPDVVITVDPEFSVDIYEQRDAATGAPTLGFWIQSLEAYPCSDPQIMAQTSLVDGKIEVKILGVDASVCSPGLSVAKRFLPLAPLGIGDHPIKFTLGPITNDGIMRVGEDRYELVLPDPKGIDIQQYVLNSIPEQLFWGIIQTNNSTLSEKAAMCVSELKSKSIDAGLSPGFYGYFTLSATGQTAAHKSIKNEDSDVFFLRKATNGLDNVREVLQKYRDDQDTPLKIRCFSTAGEL